MRSCTRAPHLPRNPLSLLDPVSTTTSLWRKKRKNIGWIPHISNWNQRCVFHRSNITYFGKTSVLLELSSITDKFCIKKSGYPEKPTTAFNFILRDELLKLDPLETGNCFQWSPGREARSKPSRSHSTWKK